MVWAVSFTPTAEKTFGKLDRPLQRRIQKFIDTRLQTDEDPRRLGGSLYRAAQGVPEIPHRRSSPRSELDVLRYRVRIEPLLIASAARVASLKADWLRFFTASPPLCQARAVIGFDPIRAEQGSSST